MAVDLRDPTSAFMHRYRGLPAAALLPQFFLSFGWLRAATAHTIDGSWWSGDYLTEFLNAETDMAIGAYEPFLNNIVSRLPTVTSIIVVSIELVIGVLLALNVKALRALLVGAFLNVQFMLAGVVNPSAFYLVIALVVIMWRIERSASLSTSRKWAKAATIASGAVTIVLLPYISSLSPEHAIDDPALVLIFLSALFTAATWFTYQRIVLSSQTFEQLGL